MSDRRVLLGRPRPTTVRRFLPFTAPAQSAVDRAFDITPGKIWTAVDAAKDAGMTATQAAAERSIMDQQADMKMRIMEAKADMLLAAMLKASPILVSTAALIGGYNQFFPNITDKRLLLRRNK